MEAVVGRKVVDGKQNNDEEHLCVFGNRISVDIFYASLDYRPLSGINDSVEGSIVQLYRLDSWVKTMLSCVKRSKKSGAHKK